LTDIGGGQDCLFCLCSKCYEDRCCNCGAVVTGAHIVINRKTVEVLIWAKQSNIQRLEQIGRLCRVGEEQNIMRKIFGYELGGNM